MSTQASEECSGRPRSFVEEAPVAVTSEKEGIATESKAVQPPPPPPG